MQTQHRSFGIQLQRVHSLPAGLFDRLTVSVLHPCVHYTATEASRQEAVLACVCVCVPPTPAAADMVAPHMQICWSMIDLGSRSGHILNWS